MGVSCGWAAPWSAVRWSCGCTWPTRCRRTSSGGGPVPLGSGAPSGCFARFSGLAGPITHDLDLPGAGNIDHLAVGPAGVFVLDSKAWSGVVTVEQDGATITPRDDPDA